MIRAVKGKRSLSYTYSKLVPVAADDDDDVGEGGHFSVVSGHDDYKTACLVSTTRRAMRK